MKLSLLVATCLRAVAVLAICGLSTAARADVQLAAELGITPESMVIAGASASQAATVLAQLETESTLRNQLDAQKTAANTAAQAITALAANWASNPTSELESQYQSAVSQLESIRSQVNAVRNSLFEAITVGLPTQQIERLESWRLSMGRQVPPEFRVTARSDDQWTSIELALRAESRAIRRDEAVPSAAASLLSSVRSELAVVDAHSALSSQLATVAAAFEN